MPDFGGSAVGGLAGPGGLSGGFGPSSGGPGGGRGQGYGDPGRYGGGYSADIANDPGLSMGQQGMLAQNPGQFSETNAAAIEAMVQKAPTVKAGLVTAVAGILSGITFGVPIGVVVAGLVAKTGISKALATTLSNAVATGSATPEQAASAVDRYGHADNTSFDPQSFTMPGSPTEQEGKQDPLNDDFWNQFLAEFRMTKESMEADEKFKREQLNPVFNTYKDRLAGMSNAPGFQPIKVRFGDFQTQFMPKRATDAAKDILATEIAKTDINLPGTVQQRYTDKLQELAQWQQELKQAKKIADKQYDKDDAGTWTDALADLLDLGSKADDLLDIGGWFS